MSTSRRSFFGKGSVVVSSDGEGAVRRLAITADKLLTRPFEGIDVIPDLVMYAERTHGSRDAVGWRNIIGIHEEEKEVKKTVGGKEVTETKKWKYFELSDFEYISFLDVRERVLELARGLLHHGILKTDVFNIYAQTSVNWQLMSHACATIATPVATAYDILSEAGLTHSLNEPNCVGIFTNAELLPTLSRIIKDTPSVRLVVYDGDAKSTLLDQIRAVRDDIAVVSIDELRATGWEHPLDILEPRKPSPDDVALIMYTSGSTGAPKGVVLTHRNVVASIGGVFYLVGHHLREDDGFLAYLPLAHILEYVVELALFTVGMKTGYGRVKTLTDASVRNCKGDIAAFQPTILVGVPHVWEMIRKDILAEVNVRRSFWKSISSSVRAATGGRLRLALSGGAALSKETQEFFSAALVTMLQGYGMTESCAMCAILPPELMQYDVVGLPSPCIEIKLIDVPWYKTFDNPPQGEVCIRGPSVTKGYYKRPDLNEDETIFTKDGWFRTGDVGQWNPDGTLSLIDRIENLVKLQGGEYIALERLEATYKSCNLVSNICVYASAEVKQPIAIIIPHEPNLRYLLTKRSLPGVDATASLPDLCHNETVQELVLKECNVVGKKNDFKAMEMLGAIILTAEEWTPESGLVTAVQTVQRRKIAKHFQHFMGRFHPLQDNEELARTNSVFDRLKSEHATVQRNNSNMQSALDAQKGVVARTNQKISNLQSALKTAQEDAKRERLETETLKADYAAKVTRVQRDNSDLQSSLDAQRGVVTKANQKISDLESALKTAQENVERRRVEVETLKADYTAKVTRVQRNNSDLQSSLDSQKGAVAKANQKISDLGSALKTAQEDAERGRVEAETLVADYAAKITRFQRGNSDLQSSLDAQKRAVAKANQTISDLESALKTAQEDAERGRVEAGTLMADLKSTLDALKREVAEGKLRFSLGIADFKQWMRESSIAADTLISADPSTSSSDIHHVLAHNALVKVHLKNWSSAYEDAKKSVVARPSAMGYITKALAQIGMGEPKEAMQAFDLAFRNCNPNESELLLLVKTILLFMARKCDTAISRVHDLIAVSKDDETMYYYIQVLGKMHLIQGDYARAVQSLERGHDLASSSASSDMETVSLIFGWTFDGLQITVQRYLCEDLYAHSRVQEATEGLLKLLDTFGEEMRTRQGPVDWVVDLKRKCIESLETLGDAALSSGEHGDAIAQYTSALSLNPANPIDILVKRSKARALKEAWEDAQKDADEVIKQVPSSHLGYERKYAALHGAEDYSEANNALLHMLSIIESSPDPEIRRLRANYTAPRETIAAIDIAVPEILSLCPLVLIDLTTGRLCNAQDRIQIFKSETPFKKLVSETAMRKIDCMHIRQSVAKYFKWIMFSHTWEGREPTLKDVNLVNSVRELDDSPQNEKLRQFCTTASENGHRWAWSDTCCIDKDTSAILSQSLIAMYNWYEKAEETLVYLADVLSSAELGDLALTKSRWMTRAWTLQELLASKVIRFYNREWKLYLNDTRANHKESPAIKQELAKAMGVAPETITSFQPEDLGVREKLRLASTRNATVEEDVAYSLIGIFSSNIVPRYGLGKTALGELLENIVARTGDVTVIAWTGKSLSYNSALPASLAVYSQVPYSPPPMEDNELDTCVEQLRTQLASQDALAFYHRVAQLPRAIFWNRCLQLPCITFYVTKIGVQELGGSQGTLYRATVSSLGKVEFRTADVMPLKKPRKLVFAHPWLRDLHDTLDGFVSEDERETESDVGSSDEAEAKSDVGSGDGTDDASAPASPLPAEPSAPVDHFTQALRLIARLGREFNALLLEQQPNGQYKRVAAEEEIIVPGVPYKTNPKDIKVKALEII